jgi:CheY-like chemotaxis protein
VTRRASKILLVDDDDAILTSLRDLLESEGYAVETARNGREALDRLAHAPAEPPKLILLDLKMPVMDGWQFLAERSLDAGSTRVPIVLLSGLPFIPNASGVSDFLSKPINPSRLLDLVRRFCGDPGEPRASRGGAPAT